MTMKLNCFLKSMCGTTSSNFSILICDRGLIKKAIAKQCIFGCNHYYRLLPSILNWSPTWKKFAKTIPFFDFHKNNKMQRPGGKVFVEFIILCNVFNCEELSKLKIFKRQFSELFFNRAIFYSLFDVFGKERQEWRNGES